MAAITPYSQGDTLRKYRNYTNEDIINNAKEVKSLAALLRSLNLKEAGGNFNSIKRKLQILNIDTSHWTGQGWNYNEQLKDWSKYTSSVHIKKHLIKLRGHTCEICSLSTWQGKEITIELDHIDGNHTNNELFNLRLLCPNCHSQTTTWKGRKNKH